jgi:D-alanyl-D-alanine carboxypeptidase
MRRPPRILINTSTIELWPGGLLRARSNADARLMARAHMVLRRKRDGRYLAAVVGEGIQSLMPRWSREPGVDEALDHIDEVALDRGRDIDAMGVLPLDGLHERLDRLGLDDRYARETGLQLIPEPAALALAGFDRYRRPLWLTAGAARAWTMLKYAAAQDEVVLEAISGYRSHAYQLGIFERKLARGQDVRQILTVNAAPGYSEHHDGNALDIGAPGEPSAEESFEDTHAFEWLQANAARFGFRMSYPRDNPHGIVYEPWHWYHVGTSGQD